MFSDSLISKFENTPTPFYYYDMPLLRSTLEKLSKAANKYGYKVHYAVKANANTQILKTISEYGFGADCVSGNEVKMAAQCGFAPDKIVFAGVGKSDKEISDALDIKIFCFNCESVQEIQVINQIAAEKGVIAQIALRLNPGIDAHTNKCINTGLADSKFGINFNLLEDVIMQVSTLSNIRLVGLHFHIGSQILDLEPYRLLCQRSNEMQQKLRMLGHNLPVINLGGGLGIDYIDPDKNPIPDFETLLDTIHQNLEVKDGQSVHFEFGRAVVAQCGTMIARVLYTKQASKTTFAIVDAGFNDLVRPALYGSYHKIENITSKSQQMETYDVVGPICESTDVFVKAYQMPHTQRGDLLAFRSAGAYGEIMASRYNLRDFAKAYFFEEN